jgi:hypothetical protein
MGATRSFVHIQRLTAGFLFALWPILVEVAIVSLSVSTLFFRVWLSHSERKFHNSYSSVVSQEEKRFGAIGKFHFLICNKRNIIYVDNL